MKNVGIILILCAGVGCTSAGSLQRDQEYQKREELKASLVKDEKAILSEEAIGKLLSSKIRIPERAKLVVYPVDHQGLHGEAWYGHSYSRPIEFIQAEKEYLNAIEDPLMKTGRFVEISHMPHLLTPRDASLLRMREAAALMQADLLLVYRTRTQMVTKQGFLFFSKDEVTVHTSLEFLLFDVKTGVIPYAETFDGVHKEIALSSDESIWDTQQRAERQSVLAVIRITTEGLVRFFSKP